jgi:hypothetical protein
LDLIGIVSQIEQPVKFISRQDGREGDRRNLHIIDDSGM